MESSFPKNQKKVFPENTVLVISKIMKKYNIEETAEEILEKLMKKEKIKSEEIAKIIKDVAESKISEKNFHLEIQKRLNISSEKAEKIAHELQKEVLIFAGRVSIEAREEKPITTVETPKSLEAEKIEEKKLKKRNIYRESIK